MTIAQAQEMNAILTSTTMDEMDKATRSVMCLKGYTEQQVEDMPLSEFNKSMSEITTMLNRDMGAPVNMFSVGKQVYLVNYDLQKYKAGGYVEAATFGADIINNLHKIMATICTPVKWNWRKLRSVPIDLPHEHVSADMLNADFRHAYNAACFFLTVLRNLVVSSTGELTEAMAKTGVNRTAAKIILAGLLQTLDGFTPPKWCQKLRVAG